VTLASEVEGAKMYGPDGALAGTLVNLLLHPSGAAVVVGAAVRPPNALVVVGRSETYIPLGALRFERDHVWLTGGRLPKANASEEKLGYDPALTVIWSGMYIDGPSGAPVGVLKDFEFDPETGAVLGLVASEGASAAAAYGNLRIAPEAIVGYREGAVHVTLEAPDIDASGGLAKTAAATVVSATQSVSAAGDAVEDAVVRAGGAAGKAIRSVKESQLAEKAVRSVGTTWRDTVKAFKDGMKDED
jgi:hypothetical protein